MLIKQLQSGIFWASRVAAYASAAILVLMVAHIMLEIVLRTFFDTSTFALDEFVGYEVAAMSYLALGYSLETGALVRVNLLLNPLSTWPRARRAVELLCALLTLFATAVPIVFFWRSIRSAYQYGYTTGTITDIPQWVPETFMFAGLVLFWIQLFAYTIRVLRDEVDLEVAGAAQLGVD